LSYGSHNCNPATECVQLYCRGGGAEPSRPEVEAVLVHNPETGILSITYREETRAICDDGFNDYSA
jgi:hypothetical protein